MRPIFGSSFADDIKIRKKSGFSLVQMLSGIKMDKIKLELKGYGGITPF